MSDHTEHAFDPTDPHGFHTGDTHGHVILSIRTLLAVLLVLLFFTILTVFASRAEAWFAEAFDVVIPQWINVTVAMSIAVVKAVLVAMFFMQLKYDNPLNSIVLCFCIVAVGLFLGFATLDLSNRDRLYADKAGEMSRGGTGQVKRNVYENGVKVQETVVGPITQFVHEKYKAEYIEKYGLPAWEAYAASHAHDDHGHHGLSDENHSRPRHGLTPGLFVEGETEDSSAHH